jgi:hypothetical protein
MQSRKMPRAGRPAAVAALCLALAAGGPAFAGPTPEWVRQFGGTSSDEFREAATDAAGNVIVAGFTESRDPIVAKYSTTGALLWQKRVTLSAFDYATGVATDGSGNIIVSFWVGSPYDGWIAKYRPSGAELWTKTIGTPETDISHAVAADAIGNIYVAGYTRGILGDRRFGIGSDADAWVAKVSPAGRTLWIRQIGSYDDDYAYGVAVDGAGNVLVGGTTEGPLAGPDPGSDDDAWLAKYDPNGVLLWSRQIDSLERSRDDEAAAIAVDAAGNVVIGGTTDGRFVTGASTAPDAWVAKFSPTGTRSWIRQYNRFGLPPSSNDNDYGYGLAVDTAGNVVLVGERDGPGFPNYDDVFIVKYSPTGALLSDRRLDSGFDETGRAVAIDRLGNIFVAGLTEGRLGTAAFGRTDGFIAKYLP